MTAAVVLLVVLVVFAGGVVVIRWAVREVRNAEFEGEPWVPAERRRWRP